MNQLGDVLDKQLGLKLRPAAPVTNSSSWINIEWHPLENLTKRYVRNAGPSRHPGSREAPWRLGFESYRPPLFRQFN
jgi:hypothetical protein